MQDTYRTAEGSIISFEWATTQNNFLTEKEGRPVFDKVLRGSIRSSGQAKSCLNHDFIRVDQAGKEHISQTMYQRYRKEIEAFRRGEQARQSETRIEDWDGMDIARVAALKAINIETVEDIASLSDTGLQAVGMDARALQNKARAFLAVGKDPALALELAQRVETENAELKAKMSKLEEAIENSKKAAEVPPEEKPKSRKTA